MLTGNPRKSHTIVGNLIPYGDFRWFPSRRGVGNLSFREFPRKFPRLVSCNFTISLTSISFLFLNIDENKLSRKFPSVFIKLSRGFREVSDGFLCKKWGFLVKNAPKSRDFGVIRPCYCVFFKKKYVVSERFPKYLLYSFRIIGVLEDCSENMTEIRRGEE